jgi:hypothetical protein
MAMLSKQALGGGLQASHYNLTPTQVADQAYMVKSSLPRRLYVNTWMVNRSAPGFISGPKTQENG